MIYEVNQIIVPFITWTMGDIMKPIQNKYIFTYINAQITISINKLLLILENKKNKYVLYSIYSNFQCLEEQI